MFYNGAMYMHNMLRDLWFFVPCSYLDHLCLYHVFYTLLFVQNYNIQDLLYIFCFNFWNFLLSLYITEVLNKFARTKEIH